MKIDELQAGREMDALVAEKVMGCQVIRRSYPQSDATFELCGCPHPGGEDNDDTPWVHGTKYDRDSFSNLIPFYSTSIADAWEVLEKVKDESREREGFRIEWDGIDEWWVAPLYDPTLDCGHTNVSEGRQGRGLTAPLAICRAALKATGITEV